MITVRFSDNPNSTVFQHCTHLVALIYLKQLGLPGFENAEPPDIFLYAEDNERGGEPLNRIVGVEGLNFSEPTFTENGLVDGIEKVLFALRVRERRNVVLAESCRTVTLKGYHGIFSCIAFGAMFYMHEIQRPRPHCVLSSIDPRFCEGIKKNTGFPYSQISGEWDLDSIPHIYHSWYSGDPTPVAVLHNVEECFSIVAKQQSKLNDTMRIEF